MTVKIVTDSTADISPELAGELGIRVVPVYVRFGDQVYRDGVDIGGDEFYQRLTTGRVHPSTSQPTPHDFATAYRELSNEADSIVSIHVSQKMSGTYGSAMQGRDMAGVSSRIEILDSAVVSMGLGLITMAAARLARAGENLQTVVDEVRRAITDIRVMAAFDTLKYLVLGGRIGKAKGLVGSLLHVKPMLTMQHGELVPLGLARTRSTAIERLFQMVKTTVNVQEVGIVYSTTPEEASSLKERIGSFISRELVHIARLGPALGVHAGPGTLILAVRKGAEPVGAGTL